MLVILAVTLGTGDAISISVAALIAGALVAAVKINEKQGGRLTAVETLVPKVEKLGEHDKKATGERHALELRIVALETLETREPPERSGVYRKPQG